MKVLLAMISPEDANGGMEKHFRELANGLADQGHEIICVSSAKHLSGLNASITGHPINPKRSRHSPSLYYTIIKLLSRHSFDIAHAQGSKAAAILQRISPLFRRTKFIATIHNFKSRYPNPRAFCQTIAVSNALAADIGGTHVTVVYNGVRLPATTAPSSASALDMEWLEQLPTPVWLSVGRLVSAKGFDQLIEAFRHVKGSLIIAGSGPEAAHLSQQITVEGLGDRVKLIGHSDQVLALMAHANAVVISSRREGFSYVFAEALLAGKAVIATDVPIANEFLPKSSIVPKGSLPEEFAEFLSRDLGELHREQHPARQKAEAELLLDAMVKNTENIYRNCLMA